MNCTTCPFDKQCRKTETCQATLFDREEVIQKYSEEPEIVQAAASLVDHGRAGTLSRLQETIEFARQMKYKRLGLAYCYGMEKEVQQIAKIIRNNGMNVRAVSCTVGGIPQNEVNPGSAYCSVSCNPIGQAAQLNRENVDLVVMIGLCLGHDILFQREIKADFTTLVVKDRVHQHAPLKELAKTESTI
ncbi:MAG: DUF1847 domain-containing protein [Prolixibacteraceae bacterium]